jgi:hypothetical protein
MRGVYERSLDELKDVLSEDRQRELHVLAVPLDRTPTESEIRLAQASSSGGSWASCKGSRPRCGPNRWKRKRSLGRYTAGRCQARRWSLPRRRETGVHREGSICRLR